MAVLASATILPWLPIPSQALCVSLCYRELPACEIVFVLRPVSNIFIRMLIMVLGHSLGEMTGCCVGLLQAPVPPHPPSVCL